MAIGLLSFGLGWAPRLVMSLTVHSHYKAGSHDLVTFGARVAIVMCATMLSFLSLAAVTRVALTGREATSPITAVRSVITALPVLGPVWLACDYDSYWNLFVAWNGGWRGLAAGDIDQLVMLSETTSLMEVALLVASFAACGILTPVALAEHRTLWGSLTRGWRLMRGSRWRMIGLYFLYGVVVTVLSSPTALILIATHQAVEAGWATYLGWGVAVAMEIVESIWAVILAVAYLELRRIREGAPHEQLAEIFG
jgi:hypothetical protein